MYAGVPSSAPVRVSGEASRRPSSSLVRSSSLGVGGGAGEAEVGDAGPGAAHEDVGGLEVAVDEADLMRGGEAVAGLAEHVDDLGPGPRADTQPVAEGAALDVLHGDEDLVAVDAGLVHADDVRVLQAGHGLGLALQAFAGALAGGHRLEELEGDGAAELGVVGGVDDAHAAGAEQLLDLEAADLGDRGRGAEQGGGDVLAHLVDRREAADGLGGVAPSGLDRGACAGPVGSHRCASRSSPDPDVPRAVTRSRGREDFFRAGG
jgi:hypothetical protein